VPTPNPTPSPTPGVSPWPTPRYTAGSAPCFKIGLSVLHVYLVSVTGVISDVSASYHWVVAPEGKPADVLDGGTPSAFYELEVPARAKYMVWLRPATIPYPGYNDGRNECSYLTNPFINRNISYWGELSASPIEIGPSNYKLDFFITPPFFADQGRGYHCRIMESNTATEVRPLASLVRALSLKVKDPSGVIVDYANGQYQWMYRNSTTPPSSQLTGATVAETQNNWANVYYRWQDNVYMPYDATSQIYISTNKYQPYYDANNNAGRYINCAQLTDGNKAFGLPLSNPWSYIRTDFEFWADTGGSGGTDGKVSGTLYNCQLVERWSGSVIRSNVSSVQPQITISSAKLDGVEINSSLFIWQLYIYSGQSGTTSYKREHIVSYGFYSKGQLLRVPTTNPSFAEMPKNFGIYTEVRGSVGGEAYPCTFENISSIPANKNYELRVTRPTTTGPFPFKTVPGTCTLN
jgi:hypothetical protein